MHAPLRAYVFWALVGLAASSASTWVHYQVLHDPTYASVCDVSATVSCTDAYTSRYGSVGGVPVALLGVLYFLLMLGMVALCRSCPVARANLSAYVFVLATIGLAAVLYLAYASFFVLQAVCLLCIATYVAVVALFFTSGASRTDSMSSMPQRAAADLRTLVRTPAALAAVVVFLTASVAALALFPAGPGDRSRRNAAQTATPPTPAPASSARGALPAEGTLPDGISLPAGAVQELEGWLSTQPRVQLDVPSSGAAVVVVKFNDYQCPPCRETYMDLKPMFDKFAQEKPGKVAYVTKDFPLEPECNASVPNGLHPAACEAAVSVRLARERGSAEAMEAWLFANQPSLSPEGVRDAARRVGNVPDFEARYASTLELVRRDIAQGQQVGVRGTPTFFMNGIRLPPWPQAVFQAAIAWELRRLGQ